MVRVETLGLSTLEDPGSSLENIYGQVRARLVHPRPDPPPGWVADGKAGFASQSILKARL